MQNTPAAGTLYLNPSTAHRQLSHLTQLKAGDHPRTATGRACWGAQRQAHLYAKGAASLRKPLWQTTLQAATDGHSTDLPVQLLRGII